jgi:hypothetical protein
MRAGSAYGGYMHISNLPQSLSSNFAVLDWVRAELSKKSTAQIRAARFLSLPKFCYVDGNTSKPLDMSYIMAEIVLDRRIRPA